MTNENRYYVNFRVIVECADTDNKDTKNSFWKGIHQQSKNELTISEKEVDKLEIQFKTLFGQELVQALSRWEANQTIPVSSTQSMRLGFSFGNPYSVGYGSLLFSIAIIGVTKLIEFFQKNPQLLEQFFRVYVPQAILASVDLYQPHKPGNVVNLVCESIIFSPSLLDLFNQTDNANNKHPFYKSWDVLHRSLIVPLLITIAVLILMIIGVLEARQALIEERKELSIERAEVSKSREVLLQGYQKQIELLESENKNLMCTLRNNCQDNNSAKK